MKDKALEEAIRRLQECLSPYTKDKECCLVLSPNGDVRFFFTPGFKVSPDLAPTKNPNNNAATAKQLDYLRSLGSDVRMTDDLRKQCQRTNLTKQEADRLIKKCTAHLAQNKSPTTNGKKTNLQPLK